MLPLPLASPGGLAPGLARFDPPLSVGSIAILLPRTRHLTKQARERFARVRHHLVLRRHLLPHLLLLLVVHALHHLGHEGHEGDRYHHHEDHGILQQPQRIESGRGLKVLVGRQRRQLQRMRHHRLGRARIRVLDATGFHLGVAVLLELNLHQGKMVLGAVHAEGVDTRADRVEDEGPVLLRIRGMLSVVDGDPGGVGDGFSGGQQKFSSDDCCGFSMHPW
mmetsp:Transcript_13763/g.32740  ORF Transcript_13763/g.32740 Transcript_13763/m.32740 type:complete len:221 (-) Transcript_13763:92-754(-)